MKKIHEKKKRKKNYLLPTSLLLLLTHFICYFFPCNTTESDFPQVNLVMTGKDSNGNTVLPDADGHFRENTTIKLVCNTSASFPKVEKIVWIHDGLNESKSGNESNKFFLSHFFALPNPIAMFIIFLPFILCTNFIILRMMT